MVYPKGQYWVLPFLILYINDITNGLNILEFVHFADDATIPYSSENKVNEIPVINKELSEISKWFKANELSVNASKIDYGQS